MEIVSFLPKTINVKIVKKQRRLRLANKTQAGILLKNTVEPMTVEQKTKLQIIGERLRRARHRARFSVSGAAQMIDVPTKEMERFESGESEIKVTHFQALCTLYCEEPNLLLFGVPYRIQSLRDLTGFSDALEILAKSPVPESRNQT